VRCKDVDLPFQRNRSVVERYSRVVYHVYCNPDIMLTQVMLPETKQVLPYTRQFMNRQFLKIVNFVWIENDLINACPI